MMKLIAALAAFISLTANTQENDFPDFPGPAGWTVTVDRLREAIDPMNDFARQRHAPFYVAGVAFEVTRETGPDRSYEDRQVLTDYWALQIANLIEKHDFEFADDDQLNRMGLSKDHVRQIMLQRVPYGLRDLAEERIAKSVYVLINEEPEGCAGDNGYGAIVVGNYPTREVAGEYGELAMFIFGAGECASRGPSRTVLNGLVNIVRRTVVGH